MVACPFGVPTFEWEKPVPWIQKCTFCADRLAEGLAPSCVEICPYGALRFGERDELIAEAKKRIADNPGRYVDHVYGENENGGTSWLFLSSVPFEKIGLPTLNPEGVNARFAMNAVPPVAIAVAAIMTGIYYLTKKHRELDGKDIEVTK
jgi:formate dehydrogenase iron-sulfur subunit